MAQATKFDNLCAAQARVKVLVSLPSAPQTYYGGAANDVVDAAWKGGELVFNSSDNRLYLQTATSGTAATWKRFLDAAVTYTP